MLPKQSTRAKRRQHGKYIRLDSLAIFLIERTKLPLLDLNFPLLDDTRMFKMFSDNKRLASLFAVNS